MEKAQIDPIGMLGRVIRERLERGEVVVPGLRRVMDDLYPGWLSPAGDGCNDAAGSKVAQVRSGLDLPDQSQSNSLSSANDPD